MARPINHVDLTVSDMARSRAFYEPVMRYWGYEIIRDAPDEIIFSQADAAGVTSFALHPARPESAEKKHDRYAPGLHHLAFDAASREEVDALTLMLREIGAEILDPPAVYYEPDYYAVFFADPDGLKLEFAHTPSLNPSPSPPPSSSLLRKIDCVMIKVGDLVSAGEFYRRTLGLQPSWSDAHAIALKMPESEAEIVLHDDSDIPRECSVHYLVDDAKAAAAHLASAGCPIVVPPFEVRIGVCAVLRDPFGNLLNLLDMSKGPIATTRP